jgi:hypothetical protein
MRSAYPPPDHRKADTEEESEEQNLQHVVARAIASNEVVGIMFNRNCRCHLPAFYVRCPRMC